MSNIKTGNDMQEKADIGLIGLAVMGENLVLNMESHGYTVAVYNRTVSKVDEFVMGRGLGKRIIPAHSIEELVMALKKPRKIMMLVKAGQAVDELIEQVSQYCEPGDIIIDGGNTHYSDTLRRTGQVEEKGLLYIGTGVSGGEEGALKGPSIMPGGSAGAWPSVREIFQDIAARMKDGSPCCQWVGSGGAGHFVKMVHNGIEYGDMQLIAEAYHIMKDLLEMSYDDMHSRFIQWNRGDLDSYLIEITGAILGYRDSKGEPLAEKILDAAGQKGTGKWSVFAAMEMGTPLTLIDESVSARMISRLKDERRKASEIIHGPSPSFSGDRQVFLRDLEQALYASKIVSYAQGFSLMKAASDTYCWDLHYGEIALMWRGGCIIRSAFLEHINKAFEDDPGLKNLLVSPFFNQKISFAQTGWRRVISEAVVNGIPVPAMASALSYFDAYRADRLPANLLQAQRDYFGAHMYERTDRPRGEFFHTNWTGKGGNTASTSYNA